MFLFNKDNSNIVKINYLTTDFGSASGKEVIFKYAIFNGNSELLFSSEEITCDFDLDGGDVFLQAYIYLKSLEEFKGYTIQEG